MTLLAWLMLALLLLLAGSALDLVLGLGRLEHLARLPPRSSNAAPLVSFVIAARDEARGIDHGAALPEFRLPGALLQAFATAFASWGAAMLRPWKIRDPKSWRFGGVGAFNLVRTRAYAKAGGHTAIRLRPDDDLKLGKI